jgi:hypothetical protein
MYIGRIFYALNLAPCVSTQYNLFMFAARKAIMGFLNAPQDKELRTDSVHRPPRLTT